ncbi:hypothetical protein [Olleya sp. R77988]|uniref:hypothetical protein n=1 Tax=Olleya sp. R77988 TaxID=3093875 RepID=UPI0037C79461
MKTLATNEDKVWPQQDWPAMRFKKGLKVGSYGGHGIVRYTVEQFIEGKYIKFRFSKPKGFNGFHDFEIIEINNEKTELIHTIQMETKGLAIFSWIFAIRWLHDALIEDAFDNVENYFSENNKRTKWNPWVKFLRFIFKLIR